jgi:hypothetical protein
VLQENRDENCVRSIAFYFPSYSRGYLSVYIRCVNNESDEQKTTENEESDSEMISKRYHPKKERKTSRERDDLGKSLDHPLTTRHWSRASDREVHMTASCIDRPGLNGRPVWQRDNAVGRTRVGEMSNNLMARRTMFLRELLLSFFLGMLIHP